MVRLGTILIPEALSTLPFQGLEDGSVFLDQLDPDQLRFLHRCLVLGALVHPNRDEGELQLALAAQIRVKHLLPIIG